MIALITRFLMVTSDFLSSLHPDGFTFDFSLYPVYLYRRTVFKPTLSCSVLLLGWLSYDETLA